MQMRESHKVVKFFNIFDRTVEIEIGRAHV